MHSFRKRQGRVSKNHKPRKLAYRFILSKEVFPKQLRCDNIVDRSYLEQRLELLVRLSNSVLALNFTLIKKSFRNSE